MVVIVFGFIGPIWVSVLPAFRVGVCACRPGHSDVEACMHGLGFEVY